MTVDELKAIKGVELDAQLARLENVSRARVHQWRSRGYVPERYHKLRRDGGNSKQ